MRFVSTALGLTVALALPIGAQPRQDAAMAPGPWSISPPAAVTQNQSWRAPSLSHVANPPPGPTAAISNGFGRPLRYNIGNEWAVRAAVVVLQATGHMTSGQRSTNGDSGQRAAVWQEPLMRPIDVRTGSSQIAL